MDDLATIPNPRRGAATRLATVGPAGRVPWAPGAAGSAVGAGLVALMTLLPLAPRAKAEALGCAAALIFLVGAWAAGEAEAFYGTTDPRPVVIDEVAGQMLVFLFRPPAGWMAYLAGFVLFRILDVVKPFPARRAERLPRGWGVMTDDLVAGAYGAAAWYLAGFFIR